MKTAGYGGREIRESVVVHTNDPRNPVMELLVSGMVEVFAEIKPKTLNLTGTIGEPVTAVVEIVPRPDYPFTVKNVRAMNGQNIQLNMANKAQTGRPVYELTVTASRQAPGRILDVIYIETFVRRSRCRCPALSPKPRRTPLDQQWCSHESIYTSDEGIVRIAGDDQNPYAAGLLGHLTHWLENDNEAQQEEGPPLGRAANDVDPTETGPDRVRA